MLFECMVLGTAAKVGKDALTIEYVKSKQRDLTDDEKREFQQDKDRRFIHFTSKKSAEEILKSGSIIPTKGMVKNHFFRSHDGTNKSEMVYMFDSKEFSVNDYINNLPRDRSPFNGCYEYYAVSTKPTSYELNNFRKRAYDGAITYDGRMDIDGTDTKLTKYVLGLGEDGEYTFNEVSPDFEYLPSDELLQKLERDKVGKLRYSAKVYMSEVKKAKEGLKRYRSQRNIYRESIRKARQFAKANRQFREEQKDKNYIYEQDGRKLIVKNLGYDVIGGKKLQKVVIMGPNGNAQNTNKNLEDCSKACYMDEYNLDSIDPQIGAKYFFDNYDRSRSVEDGLPTYIGLPLENLESGTVTNEYDEEFLRYYSKKQEAKEYADKKLANKSNILTKFKNFFGKIFSGKKEHEKLLPQVDDYKEQERKDLANLGYSSVEAMNKDGNDLDLSDLVWPPQDVIKNELNRESSSLGLNNPNITKSEHETIE